MNRRAFLAGLSVPALVPPRARGASRIPLSGERRVSFNDSWRFLKAEAKAAEQPDFNDAGWNEIRLPHDWAIAGPFDSNLNPHTGARPIFGTGWYRKRFGLPESARNRYFTIEFDGAMSNARVWLNGQRLGERPYGYCSFALELTPHLRYGAEKVLAVRLSPEDRSSRWYPGAGIYRNVWLTITGPVHFGHWGTYVTTPEVTDEKATLAVKTELRNRSDREVKVALRSSIRDATAKVVTAARSELTIGPGGSTIAAASLTIARPHRWDVDDPHLYTLTSEVIEGNRAVDRYLTPFGVRTIAFNRDAGFLLNGRQLKLQGVCNHHDLGALGAAVSRRAPERQLEILKEAGVNAIRTSHNPPSPELLEHNDRLGFVVMDEAFDMWRIPKVPNRYSKYFDEWSERDVRDMVRRDRNRPSIIRWSIGNEVPEQVRADGWKDAKRLVDFFHQEDPTRPGTSAFNNPEKAIKNKLADQVDIPGINNRAWFYEQVQKDHPAWIIVGSETASCVSSRGVCHLPPEKYEKDPSLQLTSYDIIALSRRPIHVSGPPPQRARRIRLDRIRLSRRADSVLRRPHRGRLARAQLLVRNGDLAGFPKDRYYLYQSVWSKKPMVHVLPHWNWEGREGRTIPVMCYSNADEVELSLNGRSLGRKQRFAEPVELPVGPNVSRDRKFVSKYRLLWQVPYERGTLRAVGFRNGELVAADEVRTAGTPAKIAMLPDRRSIHAEGDDLSFVTVRIEDGQGTLCPGADNLIRFEVAGAGFVQAVANGNAATIEPFQAGQRRAFNGLALLIVRSKAGPGGKIQVTAAADGLEPGKTEITAGR